MSEKITVRDIYENQLVQQNDILWLKKGFWVIGTGIVLNIVLNLLHL
jgi:hypothetical protein